MSPAVRETGSIALPYFRTAGFSRLMLALEEELLGLFGAPGGSRALLMSGSGTAAMEAAVAGLFDPASDRLLIVNGGSFGQRFVEIAARHRIPHRVLTVPFEADLTAGLFADFTDYSPTGLLINQGETSIGKLYDLGIAADFCRSTGALLVVDAVSSFLNDRLDMEAQGVDCALTASQKALALPPGLAPLVLGRGRSRSSRPLRSRSTISISLPPSETRNAVRPPGRRRSRSSTSWKRGSQIFVPGAGSRPSSGGVRNSPPGSERNSGVVCPGCGYRPI